MVCTDWVTKLKAWWNVERLYNRCETAVGSASSNMSHAMARSLGNRLVGSPSVLPGSNLSTSNVTLSSSRLNTGIVKITRHQQHKLLP